MPDDELDCDQPEFWLRQAAGDLVIARGGLKGMLLEHRLFHAQQGVEKSLKSVLVAHGLRYPRTHNIRELTDLLRAGGVEVPEEADFAKDFTEFAGAMRYGGRVIPNILLSEAGCADAAETAAAVLEWARTEIARIESAPDLNPPHRRN